MSSSCWPGGMDKSRWASPQPPLWGHFLSGGARFYFLEDKLPCGSSRGGFVGSTDPEGMQSHPYHLQWYLTCLSHGWPCQLAKHCLWACAPCSDLICEERSCEPASVRACVCVSFWFVRRGASIHPSVINTQSAVCREGKSHLASSSQSQPSRRGMDREMDLNWFQTECVCAAVSFVRSVMWVGPEP